MEEEASHDLIMPDFRNYAFDLKTRSQTGPGDTLILGEFVTRYYKNES
jgi:phosphoketolase